MTDLKTVKILVPGHFNADTLETLQSIFDVTHLSHAEAGRLGEEERAGFQAIAAFGNVSAQMMRTMPNLEIVANYGVGYDSVDAGHAAQNGIMVTNTPDVLTEEVADTALGLLLMTVRELGRAEQYLRQGRWAKEGAYPLTQATLRGRSVGIMGLGRIGMAIAGRLEPFGVSIAYHNRSERDDVPYAYHKSLVALAEAVDTLILAAPGGRGTERSVGREVLEALGSDGILINIGRGTIIDDDALIKALNDRTIRAAGLDVFADEPNVPEGLMKADNAVLLPHVASASRATRRAMGDVLVDNLTRWFSGEAAVTPVPEIVKTGLQRRP